MSDLLDVAARARAFERAVRLGYRPEAVNERGAALRLTLGRVDFGIYDDAIAGMTPERKLAEWLDADDRRREMLTVRAGGEHRLGLWFVRLGGWSESGRRRVEGYGATLTEAIDDALGAWHKPPTADPGTTPDTTKPAPTPTTDLGAS